MERYALLKEHMACTEAHGDGLRSIVAWRERGFLKCFYSIINFFIGNTNKKDRKHESYICTLSRDGSIVAWRKGAF